MNLYKVSQDIVGGYDTYSDMVVCAESEDDAITIHPSKYVTHLKNGVWYGTYTKFGEYETGLDEWCESKKENFVVEFLGIANENIKRGVIVSSFHAG